MSTQNASLAHTSRKGLPVAALSLLALSFLTGCALEPVDSKPETKAPESWSSVNKTAENAVSDEWWKAFRDPGLDKVVAQALANSPSLDSAYARVRAARAAAGLADSGFWPTITGNGSFSRQRTSESQIFAGAGGRSYDTYGVNGGVSYEVDLWGRVRNNSHAAEADFRSTHADLAGARLVVAAEIAKIWFDYGQAKADRATLAETYESRTRTFELYAAREKAGIIGGDDVSRAKLDAAQAKYDLENTVIRIGVLKHALAAAVGETGATADLPEPAEVLPSVIPDVPANVPSALLKNRPDIASADMKLDAALLREGAARADFYPNLTLSAMGGFSSIHAGDLFNSGSRVWSFGPTASLPIFTGGRNDANLEQARANFDALWASYRLTVLTAFRETEDALLTADRLTGQEKLINDVVTAANETFTFTKARYEKGLSSNLEVTIAERDALNAKRLFIQVRFDRLRASANLARTLGGGWSRDTAVDKSVDDYEKHLEERNKAAEKAKEEAEAKKS